MDWMDYYDWSLNPGFDAEAEDVSEEEHWENLDKCMVARLCACGPRWEYYLSLDYIKDNNYDLDTVVKPIKKSELSKEDKMMIEAIGNAINKIFEKEAEKVMNEGLIILALKNHVRVNVNVKAVEFYNEYGVQMVLRDLDEATYNAFKERFQNF